MKLLKKEKQNKSLIICLSITLIFLTAMFAYAFRNLNPQILFQNRCQVSSIKTLNYCIENNPYVAIKIDNVFDTNKSFFKNNKEVAYYLDLDIEGKSLLSLIEKNNAQSLLNNNQKEITGKLEILSSPVHQKMLAQIKKEYIAQFAENGYTTNQSLQSILTINLINYQDDYLYIKIYGFIIIILIFLNVIILTSIIVKKLSIKRGGN